MQQRSPARTESAMVAAMRCNHSPTKTLHSTSIKRVNIVFTKHPKANSGSYSFQLLWLPLAGPRNTKSLQFRSSDPVKLD